MFVIHIKVADQEFYIPVITIFPNICLVGMVSFRKKKSSSFLIALYLNDIENFSLTHENAIRLKSLSEEIDQN